MTLNPLVYLIDPENNDRLFIGRQIKEADLEHQPFADAEAFFTAFNPHRLGCVFCELNVGPVTAFQMLNRLRQLNYGLPVILLTSHATVPLTAHAFKAGVFDVMVKPSESFQLWECATQAFEHHSRLLEEARQRDIITIRMTNLSRQELQVLQMVLDGESNKQIAARLGVSPRTIVFRRKSLMEKMNAKSVAELAFLVNAASGWPKEFQRPASLLKFHTATNLLDVSKQYVSVETSPRGLKKIGRGDNQGNEKECYCGNYNP
jgi:FixJ family two-component response regulator